MTWIVNLHKDLCKHWFYIYVYNDVSLCKAWVFPFGMVTILFDTCLCYKWFIRVRLTVWDNPTYVPIISPLAGDVTIHHEYILLSVMKQKKWEYCTPKLVTKSITLLKLQNSKQFVTDLSQTLVMNNPSQHF